MGTVKEQNQAALNSQTRSSKGSDNSKKKQSLVKKHSTNAKRGRMNAMHLVIFGLVTMAAALSHGAPMQDEVTTTPVPSDDDEIVADMVRQPRFFNIGNISIGCTVNCAKFHACRVRCLFGLRCQCTAPSG